MAHKPDEIYARHGSWLPQQTDDEGRPTGKRDQHALHIDFGLDLQLSIQTSAAEARKLRGTRLDLGEAAGRRYAAFCVTESAKCNRMTQEFVARQAAAAQDTPTPSQAGGQGTLDGFVRPANAPIV